VNQSFFMYAIGHSKWKEAISSKFQFILREDLGMWIGIIDVSVVKKMSPDMSLKNVIYF
jgi:hypothetical protein